MRPAVLRAFASGLLLVGIAAPLEAAADNNIVFENARFKAVLGPDAVWQSLTDKASGTGYLAKRRVAFAAARVGDRTRSANQARLLDGRLIVGFSGCDTELVYAIGTDDDWIAWELVEVRGPRPTTLTLVQIGVGLTERVGRRLDVAWNDRYAVCLMGTNRQTQGRPAAGRDDTRLTALTQDAPGPKLEGASAALMAAPPAELRRILRRLSVAFDMPRNEQDGVPSKELPIARQSYWFLSFGEKDVERVLELCRESGFKQVLLSSGSWCSSPGHYTINTRAYPEGLTSLRRALDRFHAEGILVGMHAFASKVSKRDPFVTPVPDRRFWVDRSARLAGDVTAEATDIVTADDLSQWPGSPVARQKLWEGGVAKHQEVIIDDEIIRYERIGPEGKWNTFQGCTRGAWKTVAAAHRSATECRHYGVDGCINGYIVDQETGLFEETTSRLADVFNGAGFDMIYFDGSEDVDRRRFDYYSANAHAVPVGKFTKRPFVHAGGGFHHNVWHSFTRSATVDTYLNTLNGYILAGGTIDQWPTVRDHIDRSVRRVESVADDMIPGELGWFGIWPKGRQTDGLQLDETEYLLAKSLAHNAPISLQTSFGQLDRHRLTPGILEIVGVYERLRLSGNVPDEQRQRLREQGKDFLLFHPEPAQPQQVPEFVEVKPLSELAGTGDLRAMIGARGAGTVASVWHYLGAEGTLRLATDRLTACDVLGRPVTIAKSDGHSTVLVGYRRTTLLFKDLAPEAAAALLAQARFEVRPPARIWLQAEKFQASAGPMVPGSAAGIDEPEALDDVVLCKARIDRSGKVPQYCEYRVEIPHKGLWTLWARVRYPTGGDMSFALAVPGSAGEPHQQRVLGNCGVNEKQWHWTGRGGGISTVPPGSPISFRLEPGPFLFRIAPREGGGTAATNPRLDCLLLTDDPNDRPTDADAKAALATGK